ncbi:membrane-bound lytic murein transglycosylase F [Marinoscillum furvescens DSM 4134]|uniref:Membrane-bound lytic murein transglycosylase F n=2 Tax=Marinoscillum furvescens TaxID=1026 RepID=A0A3D9KXV1_MARFU|nr:membrane-bound lytic murein transglycosylase F [Marinoscillum furvescens DSM 4134]
MLFCLSCTQWTSSKRDQEQQRQPKEEIVDLDLDQIKARGYLTAIMDNSSTGFFIYKGRTMGYEYELLKAFTDSLGLELRINITPSLEEGFAKLNAGEGDILAYNLTITKERKKRIAFTHYHNLVEMVLVQRKPDNWRQMKLHEIEASLIRNPVDLIGKEVYVRHHSSYIDRLQNLSEEIGGDIFIIQASPEVETEAVIRQVADGFVDFTVAEKDIAMVNATYYPNLDVETAISFPTRIAWGVRKNADGLLEALNEWILDMRKEADYYVIYDKYFKSRKAALRRTRSEYFSLGGGKLSPYDSLIQHAAKELNWDWRLLAAQIFRESGFDPAAESWVGAVGLMQLMPSTAEEHRVISRTNPRESIRGGTAHLKWLQDYFAEYVPDSTQRMRFVLAAYNVGHGHVVDAIRLTEKYGANPAAWDDVKEYLIKKSNSAFFNDPVVSYGYCRGVEPVTYVSTVLSIFENYQALFPDEAIENTLPPV